MNKNLFEIIKTTKEKNVHITIYLPLIPFYLKNKIIL